LAKQRRVNLLELGSGFAFVGRQVHLDVDGEDFYIDLLFYHLRLRSFVVIELKTGPFKPEYGKINFYCNIVDERLRHAIGLLKFMGDYSISIRADLRSTYGS
jgi:YhcG PDDEXK nuclease domain